MLLCLCLVASAAAQQQQQQQQEQQLWCPYIRCAAPVVRRGRQMHTQHSSTFLLHGFFESMTGLGRLGRFTFSGTHLVLLNDLQKFLKLEHNSRHFAWVTAFVKPFRIKKISPCGPCGPCGPCFRDGSGCRSWGKGPLKWHTRTWQRSSCRCHRCRCQRPWCQRRTCLARPVRPKPPIFRESFRFDSFCPSMIFNDLQWSSMIFNDLQWSSMIFNIFF